MAPNKCHLGGGSVWDAVVQPSPGLRIINGAMKTIPISEMEKTTGLHSLTEGKEDKVLTHSENVKLLTSHSAHNNVSEPIYQGHTQETMLD